MIKKTCLLHIGTHKTGTTSFQALLAQNSRYFRSQGLHYPLVGRNFPVAARLFSDHSRGWIHYSYGHHKLAWELSGRRRDKWSLGRSLTELQKDLQRRQAPSVLLSSEIFECLFRHPDALSVLRDALESLGYGCRVVVTLRTPTDYVQSLYTELAKWHGWTEDIDAFVGRVLADGAIAFREWDFCFDFFRLTTAFADVFGDRYVRALLYDPKDSVGPLLATCGSLLGISLRRVPTGRRLNTRQGSAGHSQSPTSHLSVLLRSSQKGGQPPTTRQVLLPSHREALDERFSKSLADAMLKYGAASL